MKTTYSYLADLIKNIPECDDLFHVFGPGDSDKSKCRCGLTYFDGKYARSIKKRDYLGDEK